MYTYFYFTIQFLDTRGILKTSYLFTNFMAVTHVKLVFFYKRSAFHEIDNFLTISLILISFLRFIG